MNKDAIKYDKITDIVFWLSTDLLLKFYVNLSTVDSRDNSRKYLYSENTYRSKFSDVEFSTSITRNFSYGLFFTSITNRELFIPFGNEEMYAVRTALTYIENEIKTKFFGDNDGNLKIKHSEKYELILGKNVLSLELSVLRLNDQYVPSVRISINDIFYDITVDRFMGFKYIIDSINLYQSAITLINYIGIPEYGTNNFGSNNGYNQYTPKSEENRKSYFERHMKK